MEIQNLLRLHAILAVLLFSQLAFAQTPPLEVVFDQDDHQFFTPYPSQLISVYKNKTLLVTGLKKPTRTTPGYIRIFKSDDMGHTWDTIFNKADTSDFGLITDIYQTGDSDVVILHSKLREDTNSIRWRPKYFMSYSDDLCQTWTEYDLKMPLGVKPWYMDVNGSEVVFLSHVEEKTIVWRSKNRGKDWNQYPLGRAYYGTIKTIDEDEYALFSDSIYYIKNLENPNISAEAGGYEGYSSLNVIFKNKDTLWSARPVPSGIGNLQKSVIVQNTTANGWETIIDTLEGEKHPWSQRGLAENISYKDEMMCFVGPSLFYSSLNNGKTWQAFYVEDLALSSGSRGVVCIKDEESGNYHIFYALAGEALVVKYTLKTATSIEEASELLATSVYPNPAQHRIYVSNSSHEPLSYKIIDLKGRVLEEKRMTERHIDIQHIPEGQYLLELSSKTQKALKRLTIFR